MTIAVNARYLLPDYLEGYGYFLSETLQRITQSNPSHEFLFIFDRPYDERFLFSPNVKAVVAGPPARHPLLWKFWYDVKVPSILKKYKADVFFSADGFCSLHTTVPQAIVVHDLAFLHDRSFMKTSHFLFYRKYSEKFMKKAARIATVSAHTRKDILAQYPSIPQDKIDIIYSASKTSFSPLTPDEKMLVKERYTNGQEYFIYAGAIHPRKNLLNLLKAFSIFKKRQKSSMKLVLAGRLAWKYDSFLKDLQHYKFREDVVLTGYIPEEELVKLMASAYALVYTSFHEGFGVPVLEAMRCGVPVLTSVDSAMQEIAGDAALYADPKDHQSIAEGMMRLYKDETLAQQFGRKGIEVEKSFSWDRTAALLWESILRAMV